MDEEFTCGMCNSSKKLSEHDTGLVLNDSYFVCCDCCRNTANDSLYIQLTSKMGSATSYRPILRWRHENENGK